MHYLIRSLITAVCISLCGTAAAGDGPCDRCGCTACLERVCVPQPSEKVITKVCWDFKCEDVCIPGPSKCCGVQCAEDECGCWTYRLWQATCARVKTRRVPVKIEVKRKVPSVKWVVKYCCPGCCQAAAAESQALAQPPGGDPPAASPSDIPTPPAPR